MPGEMDELASTPRLLLALEQVFDAGAGVV
jgi:hypothetical protein